MGLCLVPWPNSCIHSPRGHREGQAQAPPTQVELPRRLLTLWGKPVVVTQPALRRAIAPLGLKPHHPPKLSGHLMSTARQDLYSRVPVCPGDPWAGGGKEG